MRGRAFALGGCVLAAALSVFAGVAAAQSPNERNIDVSPSTHQFGAQCAGVASAPRTFTISNTAQNGGQDLRVGSISLSGANDFSFRDPTPVRIAPQHDVSFAVTFTPNARGKRTATFTVHSDDPDTPDFPVGVTGVGIDRRLSADRPTVSFGNQRVKTRSPTQSLIVRNLGGDPVTVTAIARRGANGRDFVIGAQAVPFTIAPGDFRTLTVAFQPSAAGIRSAAVEFTSNACANPTLRVGLVGTGVDPNVAVDPNPVDAGTSPKDVPGPPTSVTVTNNGGAALKVTAVQIVGADAADFALSGLPVMPSTLQPHDSFVFAVTMTPTATGLRTAGINVISDDPDAPTLSIALSGTGGTATSSPTAKPRPPTPSPAASSTSLTKPHAAAGPSNDTFAIGVVLGGVLAAFAGLLIVRRVMAPSDLD
jgi:hypothetical protein